MTRFPTILAVVSVGLGLAVGGCAGIKGANDGNDNGSSGNSGTGARSGGPGGTGVRLDGGVNPTGCQKLQCQQTSCTQGNCQQHACPNMGKTTVSGTIYDPGGRNPLYNVIVYVPNADLAPITDGVSCDQCNGTATGSPIASALTDATGHFVLDNAPVGSDIPLVIQIGKWRRQLSIPSVTACQDNPVADTDHSLLRLPARQSEGHLPKIAFSTGHSDSLDCLMRKIGIADSEFTPDSGTGRVHMYVGLDAGNGTGPASLASGGAFASSYDTLFNNYSKLAGYDILMLNCEGGSPSPLPPAGSFENIRKYADNGGRIFDEHVHKFWIMKGLPPWPSVAVWDDSAVDVNATASIDTTFPKGMALSQWLGSLGALTAGQISLTAVEHSIDAVVAPSQRWIYTADGHTQYMTYNTPMEAPVAAQCGRVVFTDLHVGSGGGAPNLPAGNKPPFPTDCSSSTTMSPQEKALEFMFFDLSSCVQPESVPPTPVPIP
jgi:hypothetical protein